MELLLEHKNSLDSEKATNLLEAVRRGGLRLERLVKDFLILQQMEAGITQEIFASHASHVSVSELVERFMGFRAPAYQQEGIELLVSDHSDGVAVKVVESNILDCVDRLVSNAAKFSETIKVVEIEIETQGQEVRISVKDRGCGIDAADVEDAFNTFNQINRESKEQQGEEWDSPSRGDTPAPIEDALNSESEVVVDPWLRWFSLWQRVRLRPRIIP